MALAVASRAPLAASVVGLMAFGILHNAFELRYVVRRCRPVLRGRFVAVVLGLITAVAFLRLLGPAPGARRAELVLGFAVLTVGLVRGAGSSPLLVGAGLPAVAAAAWLSWQHLDLYFVAVTYLHNLVPLVFLWDWSARLPAGRRTPFRLAQLGWFVAVPALLLSGLVPVAAPGASWLGFAGPAAGHAAAVTPAAWRATATAPRFLAVFAFLQVMHYGFWCWFFPRREVAESAPPPAPRRHWPVAAVVALAALFAVGFALAWTGAKTGYTAVASYHAYLEYAVLAALLAAPRHRRADR